MKKDIMKCDYCLEDKTSNLLFNARKNFAGIKVQEILSIVSHRTVSVGLPINLCGICVSTLLSMTASVKKIQQLVDKLSAANARRYSVSQSGEEGLGATAAVHSQIDEETSKTPSKGSNKKLANKVIARRDSLINQNIGYTTEEDVDGTNAENKTKQSNTKEILPEEKLDIDLNDTVLLTPSKKQPSKIEHLIFHTENGTDKNSTDSEDVDVDVKASCPPEKAMKFSCEICDFTSKYAKSFKDHLRNVHSQQRTRIYKCCECTKSFGTEKTLTNHVNNVHKLVTIAETNTIIKVKPKPLIIKMGNKKSNATPAPNLTETAVIESNVQAAIEVKKDLDGVLESDEVMSEPNKKSLENNLSALAVNSDYTFDINNSNKASTPKIPVEKSNLKIQCEICHETIKSHAGLKTHLENVHKIKNPKPFKCLKCGSAFTTNQNLRRHVANIHEQSENTTKEVTINKRKRLSSVVFSKDEQLAQPAAKKTNNVTAVAQWEGKVDESPTKKRKHLDSNGFSNEEDLLEPMSTTSKNTSLKKNPNPKEILSSKIMTTEDLNNTIKSSPKKKFAKPSSPQRLLSPSKVKVPKAERTLKNDESKTPSADLRKNDAHSLTSSNVPMSADSYIDSFFGNTSHANESVVQCLECTVCGKMLYSPEGLDAHMLRKHSNIMKCVLCKKRFSSGDEYVAHFENSCHEDAGFICGVKKCGKIFANLEFLNRHLTKKHNF